MLSIKTSLWILASLAAICGPQRSAHAGDGGTVEINITLTPSFNQCRTPSFDSLCESLPPPARQVFSYLSEVKATVLSDLSREANQNIDETILRASANVEILRMGARYRIEVDKRMATRFETRALVQEAEREAKELLIGILKRTADQVNRDELIRAVRETKILFARDMDPETPLFRDHLKYEFITCGLDGMEINAVGINKRETGKAVILCPGIYYGLYRYRPEERKVALIWLLGHELGHVADFESALRWKYKDHRLDRLYGDLARSNPALFSSAQLRSSERETWADFLGNAVLGGYLAAELRERGGLNRSQFQSLVGTSMFFLCESNKNPSDSHHGYLPTQLRGKLLLENETIAKGLACDR